jgi:hypothetical protein
MPLHSIPPHRLFFSPVRAFCADTPAPPVGPSALTPPSEAGSAARRRTWPSRGLTRAGPAGRPASASLRRRTAPRPGDVPPARDPHLCAPPPGPGRARAGLYDRRLGSWPLPDRVRSTSRLPGPAGPGLHCHVTHALRGARAAPGGPAATPPAYKWSATPLAYGLYDRQLGPRPLPDRVRPVSRQPGPSGPGLRCHVTHACAARVRPPGGPAATPPADGGHRDSRGGAGGRNLRSRPRRLRWAQRTHGSREGTCAPPPVSPRSL